SLWTLYRPFHRRRAIAPRAPLHHRTVPRDRKKALPHNPPPPSPCKLFFPPSLLRSFPMLSLSNSS
ncbi:hypothetical protein IscW_ISCW018989, partial [Ixodes scapularis]